MSKKPIYLMTLMMICLSGVASASETKTSLVFICHKGNHYDQVEVKYAFKGYLDEPRPIDNRPLFHSMLDFIGYSEVKYKKQWKKMYFRRALFPPKMAESDAEVIKWVASIPGGLGYVSAAPMDNANVEVCGN